MPVHTEIPPTPRSPTPRWVAGNTVRSFRDRAPERRLGPARQQRRRGAAGAPRLDAAAGKRRLP
jgi:hypothetical protein